MRFSKSGVRIIVNPIKKDGELFLLFKGQSNVSIGPESDFGRRVLQCNLYNIDTKNWSNFQFSQQHNVWFRPLRDIYPDQFSHFFKNDFELNLAPPLVNDTQQNELRGRNETRSKNNAHSNNPPSEQQDLFAGRIDSDRRAFDSGTRTSSDLSQPGNKPLSRNGESNRSGIHGAGRPTNNGIEQEHDEQRIASDARESGNNRPANSSRGGRSTGNYIESEKKNDLVSGKQQRLIDNIGAIKLLDGYESREYSQHEKSLLSKYSGWGGLADSVINGGLDKYSLENLDKISTESIVESALYGYFTNDLLCTAHWQFLQAAGFKGGRVFEPAVGTGRYIANRLTSFDEDQHFTAVEIDHHSATIAKILHPDAIIINEPLQKAVGGRLHAADYDLVIGNVPFGELKIMDNTSNSNLSIHNYFLLKAIEMTRPGGVVSIITSIHTLDSNSSRFRESIKSSVQLLSAIRLPNGIFNGTAASADLLTFRVRELNDTDNLYPDIPFSKTIDVPLKARNRIRKLSESSIQIVQKDELTSFPLNECFSHKNCYIAGTPYVDTTGMGGRLGIVVEGNLDDALNSFARINSNLTNSKKWFDNKSNLVELGVPDTDLKHIMASGEPQTIGNLLAHEGSIYRITESSLIEGHYYLNGTKLSLKNFSLSEKSTKSIVSYNLVNDYVGLRDCAKHLLAVQSRDSSDDEVKSCQLKLNALYDAFVKNYDFIHTKKIRRVLRADADFGICLALEIWDDETESATKSQIFSQRIVRRAILATSASSLQEAANISLVKFGKMDIEFIESITKRSSKELMDQEPGVIFRNPSTGEYEHRTKYLIGNIVKKLREAEKFLVEDISMQANIDALRLVRPKYLTIDKISVGLGAGWLNEQYIERFIKSLFLVEDVSVSVKIIREFGASGPISKFDISLSEGSIDKYGYVLTEKWGGNDYKLNRLLMSALTSSPIEIRKKSKDLNGTYLDHEQSMEANYKVEKLRQQWDRWLITDSAASKEIEEYYNEHINVYSYEADYSGVDYQFPGLNPSFDPRDHQKEFVLSALTRGSMLNADPVGAGKTGMQIMLAYELNRLGMANMPFVVVPNHMLYQTSSEAQLMYPNAKICIVTKEDMSKENRLAFIAKTAMNKWNFAVITYSMYKEIIPPHDYLIGKLESDIQFYTNILSTSESDRISTRNALIKIKRLQEKCESVLARMDSKSSIELSQLGVDAVLYDEAHYLKNLALDMDKSIPGVGGGDSTIALIETMKMQFIRDHYYNGEESGIYFFTATPVSNTIAELYTVFRQLKPSLLRAEGINNFNQWAAQYGEIVTALEVLPEGKGYQVKSRLSSFKNVPELLGAFRSFTQCHVKEELNLPVPKAIEETIVVEPNLWQKYIFDTLTCRAQQIRSKGNKNYLGDNMLSIVSDASMASISHNALYPSAKLPLLNTKIDEVVAISYKIYVDTAEKRSAQIIFSDKSVPDGTNYSAYRHVKDSLISLGVPSDEIAFIHDCKTDDDRSRLFRKIRKGIVRIVLGSTNKLGTGSNIQDNLVAWHDLDLPWKSIELEQRRGRTVRPGNKNKTVYGKRYTTKGSFDVFRLETLNRKQGGINIVMADPKNADRKYHEEDDIDFDAMMAATSDNPIVKRKADIDSRVAKLSRQYEYFHEDLFQRKRFKDGIKTDIARLNNWMASTGQDYALAIKRKTTFIESAPNFSSEILTLDGGINIDRNYASMVKAQFTLMGYIPGVQSGDTTYINLHAAKQVISHALINLRAKSLEPTITAALFGELVTISFLPATSDDYLVRAAIYAPQLRDQSYELSDIKPYLIVQHSGRDCGHILARLISAIGNEIEKAVVTATEAIHSKSAALSSIADVDLNSEFPQMSELNRLRDEQKSIEIEVIKLVSDKGVSTKPSVLPMEEVIQAYISSGHDPDFDPYKYSAEKLSSPVDSENSIHSIRISEDISFQL